MTTKIRSVRSFARGLFGLLLLATLLPAVAHATRGVRNYPRVAQVASSLGEYTDSQVDTLTWYDTVAFTSSPYMVDQVRQRNPGIELLFNWMPQSILAVHEDETFWYPDTLWSLPRLAQLYAIKNDWFLKDTSGERIAEWNIWAANWTRYCPKGTYGSSRGLTYAEWLIQVAIPAMVNGERAWEPWGPDSGAYQGFFFEIFADCVGSFGWERYVNADPDQDGIAEGVSHGCASGGAQDSLSILYRETNEMFGPEFIDLIGDDLIVIINSGNKYIAPSWHAQMTGQKIESWLQSPPHPSWHTWWKYFYELTDYSGTNPLELGYMWAEQNMGNTGRDEIDGWDHSMIQVILRTYYSESEAERWKRWGLGTTMLGDGMFSFSAAQVWPHWQPEFDWDFGEPLGPFFIETYPVATAADSIYVRVFENGMVEVNPNDVMVNTIRAKDSRFTFWQPLTDLNVRSVGGTTLRVDFMASDEAGGDIDAYHLRRAPWPITLENWNSATVVGEPIVADAAHAVSLLVRDLPSQQRVYFAVRNQVNSVLENAISNSASATTYFPQTDNLSPAPITTARLESADQTSVVLEWNAPGDDGMVGRAALYEVRVRKDLPINSQAAWNDAEKVPNMTPFPAIPGQGETLLITGLRPDTFYGIAVRTYDDRSNLSGLSNPLSLTTDGQRPPDISVVPEQPNLTTPWAHCWPSPFTDRLTIDMSAPINVGDQIDVLDVSGRILTSLAQAEGNSFTWDGTDRRGHHLPSGTYWLRRTTARGVVDRALRVTIVR